MVHCPETIRKQMKSAFILAGTKSGAGKTIITLGIMAAFRARGLRVQPFKCGPDFIDPSLHQLAAGLTSSNLDCRMCGEKYCRGLYERKCSGCDIAVIEGVMGLFDGEEGSSAWLAGVLSVPVILVIDVRAAAQSVAAVLHGFETYKENVCIKGVIFNFCGSDRHQQLIREEVEANCRTPIIGFIRRSDELQLPHRHLGLHMGYELDGGIDFARLARQLERELDLDLLIKNTAVTAKKQAARPLSKPENRRRAILAVARDEAFCFYYEDNFELLSPHIIIKYFSPLRDKKLPEGSQGVFLGGGYPEVFAEQLAQNTEMLNSIRKFSNENGFIYGECGGFIYLGRGIYDQNDKFYDLCGIFPIEAVMGAKLRRLGYRKPTLAADCLLGRRGEVFFGHEFHYSDIRKLGEVKHLFSVNGEKHGCVYKNTAASYIHLHFAGENRIAEHIYLNLIKASND